jgi:NDP-sugar pyrophosphorylase family protein
MRIRQAVVFAGGRGERLMPLTINKPKPLVNVNQKPFFDYILYELKKSKISNVLFLTGYKGSVLEEYYKNHKQFNIKFSYLSPKAETGTRLLSSLQLLDKNFLLLYSDNYWKIQINKMINNLNFKIIKNSMTVFNNLNGSGEYGNQNNVYYDNNKLIIDYDKTRKNKFLNGVDIGYFILSKKDIINLNIKKYNKFDKILKKLILNRNIVAFNTNAQYYFITNNNSLKKFEKFVVQKKLKNISNV